VVAIVVCFSPACRRSSPPASGEVADRIVIRKAAHTLVLMKGDREVATYKVAIGRNPGGAKTQRGDHKTPEGNYLIDVMKSNSRFHRALHISYPNLADQERAQAAGVNPGGDVEIHGIENGLGWIGSLHRRIDWTDGCIAVTDNEIEEIWNKVKVGTHVEIRP
jgi:murein L,D-transpeptidase YafK